MAETVKSIFRQREVEKLYKISVCEHYETFGYCTKYSIEIDDDSKNILSDKTIGEYDVEIPMLEVGDAFFLHDISQAVIIKSRMRSSDGSITYYVLDKIVETENTKRSKEECEKEFEKYKDKCKKHRFFNF